MAIVGGVWVDEMTVDVAVPQTMVSPAPEEELVSCQKVTVPPLAATAGKVTATSLVTEPAAAGDILVLVIACRA